MFILLGQIVMTIRLPFRDFISVNTHGKLACLWDIANQYMNCSNMLRLKTHLYFFTTITPHAYVLGLLAEVRCSVGLDQ